MFEITSTTAPPYASICFIRCDWSDGTATRASGVVVGENDVLTALHVVYNPLLGWATHITITPGTDVSPSVTMPFGQFTDVNSLNGRAATWDFDGDGLLTQEESAGDLALLGLSVPLGDATGWLPVLGVAQDFRGLMAGFPARGTGMMVESVDAHASSVWSVYDIDSGLGPGASGGPLIDTINGTNYVTGVLSSGTFDDTASTYAGLDSPGTWAWLQNAIAANDTLLGMAPGRAPVVSPTMFSGTAGADTLRGTAGHDIFIGLGGNDSIDGGAGIDTADYTGTRASHIVAVLGSGAIQVADAVSARDGIDTLTNVERIHFDDVSLAFDANGSAGEAYSLYKVALGRAPDAGGLGFHIRLLDSGVSVAALSYEFIASPEFQSRYGALDNASFINLLYQNALHRAPDAGGLAFYVGNLDHGIGTRADVVTSFALSDENHANLIGVMSQGMAFT